MDFQIIMKLFAQKHISTRDFANICLLYDQCSFKNEEYCKKLEDEYFAKNNCNTEAEKFILACETVRNGINNYISDKENKNDVSKYEYALLNIQFIDRCLNVANNNKIDFNNVITEYKRMIEYVINVGFDFNIITGYYSYNKAYFDDVIVRAQNSKSLENDIKKGYDLGDNPIKYCYLDDMNPKTRKDNK